MGIDTQYLVLFFAAGSVVLFVEAMYLLFFSSSSYRKEINRRLKLMKNEPDRESVLVQLRRERGLTGGGDYRLPLVALNRLVLQSGVTIGIGRLAILVSIGGLFAFTFGVFLRGDIFQGVLIGLFSATALPYLILRIARGRRLKKFAEQFPDAIDIMVRSLRAGHPIPVAVTMVGRELPDPVGTEFGIVADEITYGADLEAAMRNLSFRCGSDDLPLFVTAVAIQGSTGGNLSEILENLSAVIRMRFKMRRKIRALAAEGRASAMILSSLPIAMFMVIWFVAPNFYASVWDQSITKVAIGMALCWMFIGNFIMYKLVNFRI